MCNILILNPDVMPIREEFDNMCYNNWHSYGLVTMVGGKLDIIKKVPESGEIDPDEIWKLLERDIEFKRILHVRHNTAGTTSLENCHPFDVFYQKKKDSEKQVVFMHNGTLYEYKSKKWVGQTYVDDDSGASDTQNFTNRVLIPYISGMDFSTGKADIHHPAMVTLLKKFWPVSSNRGILIANDQPPLILGDWKKIKGENGEEILSANDDYFKTVSRGPEKTRREEATRKAEEARKKDKGFRVVGGTSTSTATTGTAIVPLSSFDFGAKHGAFSLQTSLKHILDDWEIWDRTTAVSIGAATQDELEQIYDGGKKNTVILMDWIFTDYASLYGEFLELEEKCKKQEKHIATVAEELKDARALLRELGAFDKKEKSV